MQQPTQSSVQPDPKAACFKCKPKKRTRTLAPPFHEILYAQSGRKMDVTLDVPSQAEECPLTLAPIAEDSLEFLGSTRSYFAAFPDAKRMTLPCGHGFGALNIIYHFARRNMLCPCCRSGLDSRLSSHCVPSSFRKVFLAKIQRELSGDAREQVESDRSLARTLLMTDQPGLMPAGFAEMIRQEARAVMGVTPDEARFMVVDVQFVDLIVSGNISVRMRFFTYNDSRPPLAIFSMPLAATIENANPRVVTFSLPGGAIRRTVEAQLRDPSVCAVQLSIVVNDSEAAQTEKLCINRGLNREVFRVRKESPNSEMEWEVVLELQEGGKSLSSFKWTALLAYVNSFR